MVSPRRVSNVGGRKARHVTLDAVVGRHGRVPVGCRCRASFFVMTLEAALAEVCDLFFIGRQSMRIVAGGAPQLSVTGAEATADVHLLHLADGLRAAGRPGGGDEDSPVFMER